MSQNKLGLGSGAPVGTEPSDEKRATPSDPASTPAIPAAVTSSEATSGGGASSGVPGRLSLKVRAAAAPTNASAITTRRPRKVPKSPRSPLLRILFQSASQATITAS